MTDPKTPLTKTQDKVLRFVEAHTQERGFPPTLSEIGKACGISSKGSVAFHLKALEAKGCLRRVGPVSRGLEVLRHPFRLPVIGRVGAGGSLLAVENVEGYVTLDRNLVHGAEFLLKVKGDSMVEAGILEGDLVQVRRQEIARDGEIVVALVGEEAVVKRLRKAGGRWMLESANRRYAPIKAEFRLVGKVVGLIRQYDRSPP